ncbi:MAG TPA: hypothetical protein VE959_09885 [Bryobacteraceae bacterium]|nr:hypothetical protein [Bryobacteraceae bacterium]
MIYTCYEMIGDCRADKTEGWAYFVSNYVPLVRRLLAHYAASEAAMLERILVSLRASLFSSLDPMPERPFVAALRQRVLAQLEARPAEIPLDLETVATALAPLTLVEKQAAWFETMSYDAARTGAMLRISRETVEAIRRRAAEQIRGAVDTWSAPMLRENGRALGRAAAEAAPSGLDAQCVPVRTILDVLDGRATWLGREQMERHVTSCWHCIDHFCRMMEVVELLRASQPLPAEEAAPFRKLLGVEEARRPLWKRWTGA